MRTTLRTLGLFFAVTALGPFLLPDAAVAQAAPGAQQARPAQQKRSAPAKRSKAAPGAQAGGEKPKQDTAEALRLVENAQAAIKANKAESAVQQLSSAISGGGLPSADMARAFYLRGVAYRLQSKPAQAIADLHSALWLRNGLKDADRKEALEQRAAAYRDAGLPDQTGGDPARAAASPSTSQGAAAAVPPPTVTASKASPQAADASGGGFFSSLFGGSGTTSSPANPAEAAPAPKAPPPLQASASSWATSTNESGQKPGKAAAAPRAAPTTTAAVRQPASARTAAGTSYKVQIATSKSRSDAEALVQRVRQEHASDLGARQAEIQEGSFGGTTFYKVVVGPFADANETKPLCSKFRAKGLDCLGL